MKIRAKLERQENFGDVYRIYMVKEDLKALIKRLQEEGAVVKIHEENEASIMDDMIKDKEELFRRLIREMEENGDLAQAKLLVSSKDILLILKIGAYITWRILLDDKKVEVVEA